MRQIADEVGAVLMADIAHIAGLVAAGVAPDPFPHCHVVTTTTHKTLRGPRGSLVFARKIDKDGKNLFESINEATFPGFQGGPHNHTIGAIATALHEAASDEFVNYQRMVVHNARTLANALKARGVDIYTGGTDNHIVMVDLRSKQINGARVETLFNHLNITINKNTLKGDVSAQRPSGLRLGSPAMTTRQANDRDFELIADFIAEGIDQALVYNKLKKVADYNIRIKEAVETDAALIELKRKVVELARSLLFNNFQIYV